MICETWAPESENVMTERGCCIISSVLGSCVLVSGCMKKRLRSFSSAKSM